MAWMHSHCLSILIALFGVATSSFHERKLYDDLMINYNPLERPVANHSEPVTVMLKVSLIQIIDVDEKNQVVNVNAWLDYMWRDYKLVWDLTEYGNISDVRFPAGKIWKPDVLLYNSVDSNFDSTYPTNTIVSHTGDIHWVPPGIFKISCKIDITWFPFDEQRCFFKASPIQQSMQILVQSFQEVTGFGNIRGRFGAIRGNFSPLSMHTHRLFGSWTYDGFKLDLQPQEGGFDTSEYLPNGEWSLPLTTVNRSVKFYDCCPEPYPDLTFVLHMRRRTLYYGFNLIMPCILTTMMTLLGFTLPPDAGEKITLQITVLLSICFFLSIVSEMSPPTSEAVPLLGIFFSCCMIVVTASTIFTVYVLNLHYRTPETHEMGATTRAVLLYWLPWLLRMRRPGVCLSYATLPSLFCMRPKRHSESLMRNIKEVEANGSRSNSLDVERRVAHLMHPHMGNGGLEKLPVSQVPAVDIGQQAMLLILQRIYHELKIVTKRMVESDREEAASNNWKFAAMVVDRLCLYVFTIFIVASTLGIFSSAPYLFA